MSRFLVDRGIFEKSFWADVPAFRLFFFLMGKAAWKDGVKVGSVELKRGQVVRSLRKLQQDLTYQDGNAIKQYAIATIKRCIDDLQDQGRLNVEECSFGTLFTLVNYQQYQEFSESTTEGGRTPAEQLPNSSRTIRTKLNQVNQYPPLPPTGGGDGFEKFWEVYPKKIDKARTKALWTRLKLEDIATAILDAVLRFASSPQWLRDDGRYIPKPSTFLTGRRWEDEITPIGNKSRAVTLMETMLDAWRSGSTFRHSSGAIVPSSDLEPFDHVSQLVTERKPTAFKSKKTGNHDFFKEFEIV